LNKYIKCNVWSLAVRYDLYIYVCIYVVRHQRVKVDPKNVECKHVDWGYFARNILWWSYVKELIKLRARKMAGDF
jgi:hypothetical protein